MLGVEQEQHEGIRTRGAEGGRVGLTVATRKPSNWKTALRQMMPVASATRTSIALATLLCTCWSRR